ncbi:PadR family transcriptional regulator [Caldalkalibacillus mannanilyticus]|uniref:PadR family transcriptional regulator n=1 Tax=Caldalkalibacillus mannanilyticus TaxID=1418 RepID=UPI0004695DC2|nr:PadR family transcriptional regulator [Caldalkalibacillus mannanilyticus]
MNVNIQFKKGALELCVLYLIHKKEQYGYELAKNVSEHVEVAEGALYPLLRRLVKDGYCTTYLAESNEGPPRKYFKLTPQGEDYLQVLLHEWKKFVSGVMDLIEEGDRDE